MPVIDVPAQTVFDMQDTYGMPFEVTFELMEKRRAICNLRELVEIAVGRGWNRERTTDRINEAWRIAYPTGREAFRKWCTEGETC